MPKKKQEVKEAKNKKEKNSKIKRTSPLSKRMQAAKQGLDSQKLYPLKEALELIKARAKAKFDETIDISVNLDVDVKQSDQSIRGSIAMPSGLGKTVRIAVFAKGAKADEAAKAGADLVGAEDLAQKIEKGNLDFDRCIATPDMMAIVGKLGKVLGPKGLMPNPKLGTVTTDIKKAVESAKSGQVEFKPDKAGIIHAGLGKASFKTEALAENIKAFMKALNQAKPQSIKGNYILKATLSSTMGPAIKLDISSIAA